MRAFVGVAQLGSFSEAARSLRLSPSVVTRAIADLEARLGLVLLNRTTRSVKLTERGAIYLESCREVLEAVEGAERRARGEDAQPRGALTVAAPILFGRLHVLPVVTALLLRHPELSVRLSLSDRNVQLVEEGVDAAVRIGGLADSSLIAVRLGVVARVLVASPAYLEARGAPRSPADLATHDTIAFEALDTVNEWRFGPDGKTVVRVEPRLSVNGAEAALDAAEAGVGITRALSYQARERVAAGRLRLVLQEHAVDDLPVSLVYPARRVASTNLGAFAAMAREHFRRHPITPIRAA